MHREASAAADAAARKKAREEQEALMLGLPRGRGRVAVRNVARASCCDAAPRCSLDGSEVPMREVWCFRAGCAFLPGGSLLVRQGAGQVRGTEVDRRRRVHPVAGPHPPLPFPSSLPLSPRAMHPCLSSPKAPLSLVRTQSLAQPRAVQAGVGGAGRGHFCHKPGCVPSTQSLGPRVASGERPSWPSHKSPSKSPWPGCARQC